MFGILMVKLFDKLGFRPRRTIRSMFWTGEELGLWGSKGFANYHASSMNRYQAVFEADVGVEVNGLLYHGNRDFGCMINEIVQLIKPLIPNVTFGYRDNWSSDLNNFVNYQVPTLGMAGGSHYRWFTHANPDTMTSIDPDQLDRCFALYAAAVYVVADMTASCPRELPSNDTDSDS